MTKQELKQRASDKAFAKMTMLLIDIHAEQRRYTFKKLRWHNTWTK